MGGREWEERQSKRENIHGAAKGNPGNAGAGGLIRDLNGRWRCGFIQNIGRSTSVAAELEGVKKWTRTYSEQWNT